MYEATYRKSKRAKAHIAKDSELKEESKTILFTVVATGFMTRTTFLTPGTKSSILFAFLSHVSSRSSICGFEPRYKVCG